MSVEDRSCSVPIAIIGIGCLFPKADSVESYWANIQDGIDAITDVPPSHWRPEDYFDRDPKKPDHTYAARGGFLSPVDFPALELGISPNTLEATDTTQLLGLLVAKQALEVAGYGPGRAFDRNRVSVILGVTGTLELVIPLGARLGHPRWKKALKDAGVEESVASKVVQQIADSYVGWQEDSFPGLLGNVVAGRIANRLDLGGTNCVVDAACASSLSALHLAMLELAAGRSDMVLTGGMDTFNDIFMYMCFSKTPALSPTGKASPFDQGGDGTILGEGLGCVLLKRLDDAERDGDKIFAVIKSVGTSSDGKGQAIYAPSPAGQAKALRQAYRLAGVTPDTIELVEAHGTGTKAGDAAEVTALNDVYRNDSKDATSSWCALGSVKSQIGHTKAAAGVAGLIKAALAVYHKVLPPTIKVTKPIEQVAPGRTPFYVNTEKRPWMPPRGGHPRRAAVSAFGFGGSNFHCVLEEHNPRKEAVDWDNRVQILAFSANSPAELRQRLASWPGGLSWDDVRIHAARARAAFSSTHACRLALVIERDKTAPEQLLAAAQSTLDKYAEKESWTTPEGIYYSRGAAAGKLGMVFPGQGSQYVGMMRDLACRFPEMQATLAEANAFFTNNRQRDDARRLSDYIYPLPVFNDGDRLANEEALRATDIAQPALGVLSLGALRILERFQVRPEAVAGHSYGELVALCAAGWVDAPALHALSLLRGQLMAEGSGDRGGMLAVRAPLKTVERVIQEESLELVLANRNSANQAVLSGSSQEISRARTTFADRKIESRPLAVAAAFHSPFVADAKIPLKEALEKIDFHPTPIPVFANTTAREYPRVPQEVRCLLAGQLAEPVEFVDEIENMYESEIRTFLEVGPGNKLSGLIGAILEGRDHHILALDASSGKRSGMTDLARVLAQVAVLGHDVNLSQWDEGKAEKKTLAEKQPTLTVPICGANYVKPRDPKPVARKDTAQKAVTIPAPNVPSTNGSEAHGKEPRVIRDPANAAKAAPTSGVPTKPVHSSRPVQEVRPMVRPKSQPRGSSGAPSPAGLAQDSLLALQKLAEQTAQLHRQFLEGQDRALQVLQSLLEHQGTVPQAPHQAQVEAPRAEPLRAEPPPAISRSESVVRPVANVVPTASPALPELPNRNGSTADPVPMAVNRATEKILLDVVAEKTGYPAEMLQLDMELDTDLGIDSIKRVEIFALLQERLPNAPAVKAEHLGTLRTLRQVVAFLGESVDSLPAAASGAAPVLDTPGQGQTGVAQATAVFLAVVSEKTGYPEEMLQLDMELDTDLGIDSIKRVEIFALLQEQLPDAPPVKAEHLGTLRTLRHVIEFIASPSASNGASNGAPRGVPDATTEPVPTKKSVVTQTTEPSALERLILTAVELDTKASRKAVPLAPGSEIWITEDGSDFASSVARRLEWSGYAPRLVNLGDLSAIGKVSDLAGLIIIAPRAKIGEAFLQQAFRLLQLAAPGLRAAGRHGAAAFVTVSRLDGRFGLSRWSDDFDPVTGGLAGLTKTASHEWSEVRCKAMDLSTECNDPDEAASAIVDEMLLAGPLEVGIAPGQRFALQLSPRPLEQTKSPPPLARQDVVLITGGARGVTAETAISLAGELTPTLVLLGRSPAPTAEPEWLAQLHDEAEIKRVLLTKANGHGTPKHIGEQYRSFAANREVLRTLERIKAAGSRVIYRQVDVRNKEAVAEVVNEVRREIGPVKGLIHGAGVLADRLIGDKTIEQFEQVYATKVVALQSLLEVLEGDDLRVLALFSSSTGRFGRTGQVDYAVANEVLNKLAQREARKRPACRVVALNWGPWDGGMVTPSLKKIFEKEGLGLIPLDVGAQYFVREISQATDSPVEIVVLGTSSSSDAIVPSGRVESEGAAGQNDASLTIAFQRDLSLDAFPVLTSHVIKGHAVFPMALMVEWLAHGALHGNPGLAFHGFDGLKVLKGVVLADDQPLPLRLLTGKAVKDGSLFRVPAEIRSVSNAGRDVLHARAEILLVSKLPRFEGPLVEPAVSGYGRSKSEIYTDILFHGPRLQGIEAVEGCSENGIIALVASGSLPQAWVKQPMRSAWLANPMALDCSFQAMILWSHEQFEAGSLPCSVGRYRQFRRAFPQEGVRVVANVTKRSTHRALADVNFLDQAGDLIAQLTDYECVIDASLNQAFRSNQMTF